MKGKTMPLNYKLKSGTAPLISAFLTAVLLFITRLKGPEGILLLDRFFPGKGWIQIIAISFYGGLIAHLLITKPNSKSIRLTIWTLFSIIFFSQFISGIFISDIFLMSGKLHIPVPALIIAAPIYEGGGFFMPILFLSTIILTGPAWCSYLCYFGAWDGVASGKKAKPLFPGKFWKSVRYFIFIAVIMVSFLLRYFDISTKIAAALSIAFGIAGILIMIFISRKKGFMAHCSYYCPIGILTNFLGKVSPFRIKIDSSCTNCMKCNDICRYDALSPADLKSGKAGLTCTLCGDCISSCSSNYIHYSFFKLNPNSSRILFIVIISAIHALFLGIARI